jgi:hypothetical protein
MAIHPHRVSPSDSLDVLDLSMRVYNACRRNNVRTVGDLLELTPEEFLRFRNVGEGSLRDLRATLAVHGLAMPSAPPPPPDPTTVAEAAWIGHQLDALTEDDRVYLRNRLGTRWDGTGAPITNRRRAWAWYRWGVTPDADWPRNKDGGFGYMAVPLPGSLELHLEGLNRLAHEELGPESGE